MCDNDFMLCYLLTTYVVVVWVTLIQGRHLCRQTVPPGSPADSIQPILPLILRLAVLLLCLWEHDVTSFKADVVQDGTRRYDLKVSKIISSLKPNNKTSQNRAFFGLT